MGEGAGDFEFEVIALGCFFEECTELGIFGSAGDGLDEMLVVAERGGGIGTIYLPQEQDAAGLHGAPSLLEVGGLVGIADMMVGEHGNDHIGIMPDIGFQDVSVDGGGRARTDTLLERHLEEVLVDIDQSDRAERNVIGDELGILADTATEINDRGFGDACEILHGIVDECLLGTLIIRPQMLEAVVVFWMRGVEGDGGHGNMI